MSKSNNKTTHTTLGGRDIPAVVGYWWLRHTTPRLDEIEDVREGVHVIEHMGQLEVYTITHELHGGKQFIPTADAITSTRQFV